MGKKKKVRVALLFGGRSTEHEVSLTSAVSILKYIDKDKYDILPIRISKEGRWQALPDPKSLDSYKDLETREGRLVVVGDPELKGIIRMENNLERSASEAAPEEPVDVVFPILHGTFGEDGTMQGLLSLADLPCVGAGVLASAVGMDKIFMKQVFHQNSLRFTDFFWFLRKGWRKSPDGILKKIQEQIGFPCFVKPANTGSSVGISKAHDEKELPACIEKAVEYDRKIIVEKAVNGRELECGVLGNDHPEASVVGEVIPCHEFYDYEAKYLLEGSRVIVPADIPEEVSEEVRRMAVAAFKAIDCAGMGRVDFLLEEGTHRIFVNEINTIPGFTPISMYPKLWEASGVPYSELIDRLIELALERHEDLSRSKFRRE